MCVCVQYVGSIVIRFTPDINHQPVDVRQYYDKIRYDRENAIAIQNESGDSNGGNV